jgi:hypothetical protein
MPFTLALVDAAPARVSLDRRRDVPTVTAHLHGLAESPKLFARNFDVTHGAKVLDLIDRHLVGANGSSALVAAPVESGQASYDRGRLFPGLGHLLRFS